MPRLSLREFLRTSLALGLLLALFAPAGGAVDEIEPGGTLVYVLGGAPQSLNMSLSVVHFDAVAASPMMEGLIRVERHTGKIRPVLAEQWSISEDGLTYVFNLRKGVEWHDGKPFTAADVVFTFKEMLPFHPASAGLLKRMDEVVAVDDFTVKITLNAPFAPMLISMTEENVAIQPEHVFEGTDIVANPANLAPVGTGPFKFAAFTAGESVEVVRNDAYWGAPKPYLDRLVFQVIPDKSSQVRALRSGDVDLINAFTLDPAAIAELEADDSVMLDPGRNPAVEMAMLFYNTLRPPLDDRRVRQALLMALDRELIVRSAYSGHADVGTSAIPARFGWAHDGTVDLGAMYGYNLQAAASLLDKAGLPADADGKRLSLEFLYRSDNTGALALADILRSGWAQIGIDVTLVARESAVWKEDFFATRNYDVSYGTYTSRKDPELGVARVYRCEKDSTRAWTNPTGYCNSQADALWNAAATATDLEERGRLYSKVQRMLAEDIPTVLLAELIQYDAVNVKVGGFEKFNQGSTNEVLWEDLYFKN
jgi:peptide/nickel transport system substrate-binding protein